MCYYYESLAEQQHLFSYFTQRMEVAMRVCEGFTAAVQGLLITNSISGAYNREGYIPVLFDVT